MSLPRSDSNPSIIVSTDDLTLDGGDAHGSIQYLQLPHNPKMHLISPPGSPPVGWEQVAEDHPNPDPLAEDLHADAFVLNSATVAASDARRRSTGPADDQRQSEALVSAVSAKLAQMLSASPAATSDLLPSGAPGPRNHPAHLLKLRTDSVGRAVASAVSPASAVRHLLDDPLDAPATLPGSPVALALGSPMLRTATPAAHEMWLDAGLLGTSPTAGRTGSPGLMADPDASSDLDDDAGAIHEDSAPAVTIIVPGISDRPARHHTLAAASSGSLSSLLGEDGAGAGAGTAAAAADGSPTALSTSPAAALDVPVIVVQDHSPSARPGARSSGPARGMSLPVPGARAVMPVPLPRSSVLTRTSPIPQTRMPPPLA
ncbi:hypothetical protein H9P43_000077 [Blastocladiella emersonii ATCC 22665]|nr:hypothetical protein H9P43_000077 [Blastocladiella emersonii ATCC 22665]